MDPGELEEFEIPVLDVPEDIWKLVTCRSIMFPSEYCDFQVSFVSRGTKSMAAPCPSKISRSFSSNSPRKSEVLRARPQARRRGICEPIAVCRERRRDRRERGD